MMRLWSKPARLFALLLLPALLGLGGLLTLASARSQSPTAIESNSSQNANVSAGERANKASARQDTQALIAGLTLPADARRTRGAPVPSVLYARSLSVLLVALPGGSTAIRADAADMWDIPRPASERVPSQASVLDVSVTRPYARPSLSLTVTDRVKVKKIARAIDRLPTVQPIAIACPNIPVDARAVTFTFRAASRGPALAQVSESVSASGPLAPCEPMHFTLAGRVLTPLLGGATVVEQDP